MNNVERFDKLMRFESVDRLPVLEWAPWWNETIDPWYEQGLPRELTGNEEIAAHFGLDVYHQLWLRPRRPGCPEPASHGAPIINNEAEYDALLEKGLLYGDDFDRDALAQWGARQDAGEVVVWLTLEGFFWHPRTLFGIEPHMYAFYDHPELMHRMNRDLVAHSLRMIDEVCKIVTPRFMTFAEDMSYNHGPMLSKDTFDEFLAPYYREIVPVLNERGIIPIVDSDGQVMPMIPWLEEVGLAGILPLERMAGVDVAEIRREHPEFLMIGAFDKTVMHKGEQAMRDEFERLLPVMQTGGFIPSVDHQTPPAVSMEQYKLYVKLLNEYAVKAAEAM